MQWLVITAQRLRREFGQDERKMGRLQIFGKHHPVVFHLDVAGSRNVSLYPGQRQDLGRLG